MAGKEENRILVSVIEGMPEPEWLCGILPFLNKVMAVLNFTGEEFSLLFCNDKFIQELNKNYRNIDSATDVLSFENDEEYTDEDGKKWVEVGDIAISLETLKKNAEYFNTDVNSELKRLLVHGVLHLNGMDHGEEHIEAGKEPQCEMLLLQEKILKQLQDEIILT